MPTSPDGSEPAAPPQPGQPRLRLRYAALSDVGRVRKDNQDSGFASEHLLVVADGVGGAARGDVASSTAVDALRRLDGAPAGDPLEALAGAIHRAHDRIAELVEQDSSLEGTSTTVTSALFDGHRIGVGHVGDSRGYLLRDGTLSQLTKDHTFVQTLVDEGRISELESRTHPHRNLILRAVDGVHETDPDLFFVELAPGDRLLLCSDGASGVLDAGRLTDILGTGSVDYAVVELVRASLAAGSSDNVTCVVADVVAGDADAGTDAAPAETLLVGAIAEQARRSGPRGAGSLFRGHRSGDTGEIEPVAGDGTAAQDDDDGDDGDQDDPEQLRYAPRPPRRGRWARRLLALVVLALVLAVVAVLGYRWSQDQYFVAEHAGAVAIFRGVQADIPGISMNHVVEQTDVTVAALGDDPTEQVTAGISATSLADARQIVSRLTSLATPCPTTSPTTGPTPTATATPRASATPRPSAGATPRATRSAAATGSPRPTAGPSPSASPSATLRPPDCIEAAR